MQLARIAVAVLVVTSAVGFARAENPEHLDRPGITSGIAKLKPKVLACRDKVPTAKGRVQVKVTVNPEGKVSTITILETPDPALGTCVSDVMKSGKFGASKNGGSFIYPFMF